MKNTSKYVILYGIGVGNTFITYNGDDVTKLKDGTVAYKVIGYADTVWDAQVLLGIPECHRTCDRDS
jgi:hypothetical protein